MLDLRRRTPRRDGLPNGKASFLDGGVMTSRTVSLDERTAAAELYLPIRILQFSDSEFRFEKAIGIISATR
jgi:hypothetical protein